MFLQSPSLTHAALWLLSLPTLGLSVLNPSSTPSKLGRPTTASAACSPVGHRRLQARAPGPDPCKLLGGPAEKRLNRESAWLFGMPEATVLHRTSEETVAGVTLTVMTELAGFRLTLHVQPGELWNVPRGSEVTALRNIQFYLNVPAHNDRHGRLITPEPIPVLSIDDMPLGGTKPVERTALLPRKTWNRVTKDFQGDIGKIKMQVTYQTEYQ